MAYIAVPSISGRPMTNTIDTSIIRFSTARWPEPRRRSELLAFYGHYIKQEIEPLPGQPLFYDGRVRRLPGLIISLAASSGLVARRTIDHVTDDNVWFNFNL